MIPEETAATEASGQPDTEEAGVDISSFAAEIMEKQPFRGYEIRACLGSGDRTAVFKAHDANMERTVAIKAMRPCPGREGVVEDFFSLAGSIARLRTPAAARGLDAGRGDGVFFLAYEYVQGENLAARMARRQTLFTEKESLKLAGMLAGLLRDLFEQGHPHGHLRPSNVMLVEGGRGKLTDIGFAWTLAWPDDAAAFAARPDCLPPERIEGDLNVDIRGDLYSLGAIWHQALLGRPVFVGATPEETLAMHVEARPANPRDIDPRLSSATAKLMLWLLEKDRDARPRTPREFLRKLASHPLLASPAEGAGDAAGTPDGSALPLSSDAPPGGEDDESSDREEE